MEIMGQPIKTKQFITFHFHTIVGLITYVCCQFIFNQLGNISASTTGTHSHQISPGKMMKRCKKDERIQNSNIALKDGIYLKRGPF